MSNFRSALGAFGIHSTAVFVTLSAAIFLLLTRIIRKFDDQSAFLFGIAASCFLTSYLFLHDLSLLLIPILVVANTCVRASNYFGITLVAVALVMPLLAPILWGGTFWLCAICPVLIMIAIRTSVLSSPRIALFEKPARNLIPI
jgi:hypothetical protein